MADPAPQANALKFKNIAVADTANGEIPTEARGADMGAREWHRACRSVAAKVRRT